MDGVNAYKNARILTAEPVRVTAMLLDGGVRAMRKARVHNEAGRREPFVSEIERASLIVGELRAALDMEQGGEIAKNLADLYAYCLRCLFDASLGDMERLAEAEKVVARVADAWRQANLGEGAGAPASPPPAGGQSAAA